MEVFFGIIIDIIPLNQRKYYALMHRTHTAKGLKRIRLILYDTENIIPHTSASDSKQKKDSFSFAKKMIINFKMKIFIFSN